MTRPDLVIFDCDGVLVDTEALANQHLIKMLNAAGYREAVRALGGMRRARTSAACRCAR